MIVSEKSHQNLSDYTQFIFKKRFEFNIKKKELFLVKEWEIQVIITMIMLTRSSERILNPWRWYCYICYVSWICSETQLLKHKWSSIQNVGYKQNNFSSVLCKKVFTHSTSSLENTLFLLQDFDQLETNLPWK